MAAQLSPEIAAQPATKGQLVELLHVCMKMIKNNLPPAESGTAAALLKLESQVAECVKQSTLEDYLCFVLADFRGLQARMAALEKAPPNSAGAPSDPEKIASMERRLSRHAQHLSALETRLKAVEHK